MSKRKKKSGSPFPIILILIIAGVVGSNFVGPSKGWLTKAINSGREVPASDAGLQETAQNAEAEKETKKEPVEESKKVVKKETKEVKPEVEPKPEEKTGPSSEIEKMHKKFIDEYLAKANKPEIGKRYKIPTLTNATRDGELEKMDKYKVYLIKVKPYNAKTNIHYSQLTPKARTYFFPEKAANSYANKKLEEFLREQNKIVEVVEESVTTTTGTAKPMASSSFSKFDTTVTDSSKRLAHAALEVKNYLANQSRISKKRDGIEFADIEKCHAKQQGKASVFYMYVPQSFVKTSQEFRFQVIDGVRRFWALRCMSNAVSVASNSYLCVVYKDKIIGGSNLKDAEDTWSK
ncbi:MAG: hypothetical protein MK132_06865 [Lentisphaerales bacterium]|nr:hypothetical protein [Lentisphaerales bacterium]